MPAANSPLRYPGGKAALADLLAEIVEINALRDCVYVEPYAGGAGAAFGLLFAEHVRRVVLNDADPCVYAFWEAILNRTKAFIKRVKDTPVTIEEWKRQRKIYRQHGRYSLIKVAFATFYLNRCNHSGIMLNGGPIGGLEQKGKWKVDARYNKEALIDRIDKISLYRDRIAVHNMDAIKFLRQVVEKSDAPEETLVYLDPPYFVKGSELYLNHYQYKDHVLLARYIQDQTSFKWVMTYDDVPEIHELYSDKQSMQFSLRYCARTKRAGRELLIWADDVLVPATLTSANPAE